jgi:cytochrome c553
VKTFLFLPSTALTHLLAAAIWLLAGTAGAAPFENTIAQRTMACTACHGAQGRAGPDGYYPRLAGKPAGYLYNQLLNFRDGRRHYALMTQLVDPLTDDYLMEIARYFSALDLPYPPPAAPAAAPDVLRRGKALVLQGDPGRRLPACVSCHGQAMTGVAPHVPGLLGLPRDYLNAQLGAWRTGQRRAHAPDCMANIVGQMNDADIHAATSWLAAQPLPASSKPAATLPAAPAGQVVPACGSAVAPRGTRP